MFGILLYGKVPSFSTFPPNILGELYPWIPVRISVNFVDLSVSNVCAGAIKCTWGKSDPLNFPFKNLISP